MSHSEIELHIGLEHLNELAVIEQGAHEEFWTCSAGSGTDIRGELHVVEDI